MPEEITQTLTPKPKTAGSFFRGKMNQNPETNIGGNQKPHEFVAPTQEQRAQEMAAIAPFTKGVISFRAKDGSQTSIKGLGTHLPLNQDGSFREAQPPVTEIKIDKPGKKPNEARRQENMNSFTGLLNGVYYVNGQKRGPKKP